MSNQEVTGQYPDTITLQTGIDYTTNWRKYISTVDPGSNYIHAFNLPMSDIQSLASFTKCPSVRIYLAMATPGDVSSLKVVVVPVDINGNDVLTVPGIGTASDSTIFDFSTPCPQTCDLNSPLF